MYTKCSEGFFVGNVRDECSEGLFRGFFAGG